MYSLRRKLFSQNFLSSRKLARNLVGKSSLGPKDLVVEIGPGSGIITQELINTVGHVLAIEIDRYWVNHLNLHLPADNLTVYHQDFLSFSLPKLPYHVFANPPFAIEGKIIKKLLSAPIPPTTCHLVLHRQLALRLSKSSNTLFHISNSPWFEFAITHDFTRTDFTPVPNVDASLSHFRQKPKPLLSWSHRQSFQNFIRLGFGTGQPIRNHLKSRYPLKHIDTTLHQLSLSRKSKPSHLKSDQWISLFQHLHRSFKKTPNHALKYLPPITPITSKVTSRDKSELFMTKKPPNKTRTSMVKNLNTSSKKYCFTLKPLINIP